jgi:hypothetical protein
MVGGAVCLSSNNIRFGSFADIGSEVRLPLKSDIGRDKPTTTSGPLINRPYLNFWPASCRDKAIGACCHGMADDSDHYNDVDVVISMLKAVYCRDGADVAVQAAKHMIAAAAALVTCENGPDETRRILRIVGEAQGKAS